MRRRWQLSTLILALAVVSILTPPIAGAEPLGGRDRDPFEAVLLEHRCAVRERLDTIYRASPDDGVDRFLVVAQEDRPDRYVQCIFFDGKQAIHCEAASGYFAGPPFRPAPGDRSHLIRLGFAIEDRANHWVQLTLDDAGDLEAVTHLILDALYHVYNVGVGTELRFTAPFADFPKEESQCVPVS